MEKIKIEIQRLPKSITAWELKKYDNIKIRYEGKTIAIEIISIFKNTETCKVSVYDALCKEYILSASQQCILLARCVQIETGFYRLPCSNGLMILRAK